VLGQSDPRRSRIRAQGHSLGFRLPLRVRTGSGPAVNGGCLDRRWSECVKPVAGTESCQARHVGVAHSERIAVEHEDGTGVEIGAGDAYVIEPGHDAWVVGDERFVGFEFEQRAAEEYAKG
jgi:hypothetical protein